MEIMEFMDKAIRIETLLAECYEALAARAQPAFARELKRLSNEEVNHRNILNRGKTFITDAPDLFGGLTMPEADLDSGREVIGSLLKSIRSKRTDTQGILEKLKELEASFERVHMKVSVEIKDASLRDLFSGLSAGDRNHLEVLDKILKDLH